MSFVIQFLIAGLLLVAIDAVWLSIIANKFYKSQIGPLLLEKPNMPAALAFYLIYVFGILMFVLRPALAVDSWLIALFYGALFGLVTYATYDLTNLSTLKGYTTKLAIVDIAWGVMLTAVVSVAAYWFISTWGL